MRPALPAELRPGDHASCPDSNRGQRRSWSSTGIRHPPAIDKTGPTRIAETFTDKCSPRRHSARQQVGRQSDARESREAQAPRARDSNPDDHVLPQAFAPIIFTVQSFRSPRPTSPPRVHPLQSVRQHRTRRPRIPRRSGCRPGHTLASSGWAGGRCKPAAHASSGA